MNNTFTATFLDSSDTITLLGTSLEKNAFVLFPNLFAYSEALNPCTHVLDIIDETTVQLNHLPNKSGDFSVTFSDLVPYKYQELCESMKDVQDIVNSNGMFLQYKFRSEDDINRDKLNAIKNRSRNSLNIKAFPLEFSPTIDILEKAGFYEKQDVVAWIPAKSFADNGKNYKDIDELRDTVVINDETYMISDKNRLYQMGNDFLYIVLGLSKK